MTPAASDGAPPPGTWLNRGDTTIYHCEWLDVVTSDVLLPDGSQVDHHVVRMPRPAVGTIMQRGEQVLLLYRHRFITDSWGWEIPAGGVDPGESPAEAAVRESREETGWQPASVRRLCSFHPADGVLDQTFHIFVSNDAIEHGEPTDPNEAQRIEWVTVDRLRALLVGVSITDGLTFGAVSYALATGEIS